MKELNKSALKESFDAVDQTLDEFISELEQERYQNTKEKVWKKLEKEYEVNKGSYDISGRVIGTYLLGPDQEEHEREFQKHIVYSINLENNETSWGPTTYNVVESASINPATMRGTKVANKFFLKSAKKFAERRLEEAKDEVKKYTTVKNKYG